MNKILIVIAHPLKKGHNRFILSAIEENLKQRRLEYEILDLYKMKFDPVLKAEEHLLVKKKTVSKTITDIQKKIKKTNQLIFIYPIWWNSTPAILKGFFDRVFSSKFAYRYIEILHYFRAPLPLLQGKKAAVFTTSGAPSWIFWTYIGGRGVISVTKNTLKFCGIKAKSFHFGNAYIVTKKTEIKLTKLANKGISWLIK